MNRRIIVATDYFTQYAEKKALTLGTALDVTLYFITNVALRLGSQIITISGLGKAFTALLLDEIMRFSATFYPK